MVLLSGLRQIRKTTLARKLIYKKKGFYFTYDDTEDRAEILKKSFIVQNSLICLDEFHKYGRWKSYFKGTYDKYKNQTNFLATGSGRLDIFLISCIR